MITKGVELCFKAPFVGIAFDYLTNKIAYKVEQIVISEKKILLEELLQMQKTAVNEKEVLIDAPTIDTKENILSFRHNTIKTRKLEYIKVIDIENYLKYLNSVK